MISCLLKEEFTHKCHQSSFLCWWKVSLSGKHFWSVTESETEVWCNPKLRKPQEHKLTRFIFYFSSEFLQIRLKRSPKLLQMFRRTCVSCSFKNWTYMREKTSCHHIPVSPSLSPPGSSSCDTLKISSRSCSRLRFRGLQRRKGKEETRSWWPASESVTATSTKLSNKIFIFLIYKCRFEIIESSIFLFSWKI